MYHFHTPRSTQENLWFLIFIMLDNVWIIKRLALTEQHYKRGEAFYSLLVTRYFLLFTRYFLLVTRYFLLVTHCFLLVARYFLLVTCCYLLATHCYLLVTHYVLFVHYCITFTMFILRYTSVPEKENTGPNGWFSLIGRYCQLWCRFDCI